MEVSVCFYIYRSGGTGLSVIVTRKLSPVRIDENPSTNAPKTAGSMFPAVLKLYGA
jgi:hypothetical protein